MDNFIKYGESKQFVKRKKLNDVEVLLNERFKNPLIHRQIHGDEIYTPLDISRLWGM